MNILYFHQHFSTPAGSTGSRSYEMASSLVARGHQVTIVCGSYDGANSGLTSAFKKGVRKGTVDSIKVIEFDLAYSNKDGFLKRTLTFLKYAWKSIWLAFTEKYDLLFATSTPLTAGIPGIFARWLRRKPFVFEVRDLWPELPKAMGVIKNPGILSCMSLLERATYRSAHSLIGLSPGIVDGIHHRGIPKERIAMISNGCDLNIFSEQSDAWRPQSVKDDDFLAIYTGTHGIANGLSAVLDVACELKRRGRNDIKIVLIGQGKLKPALEARAQADGLDNVIFHSPVNKKSLAGLMASADMGLQILANVPAFYYGTSPNKFFDYISASLPVLVNYPGWQAEMVVQYRCGFAVPPENSLAFADALEQAANEREQLVMMGKKARTLAESEFSRTKLTQYFSDWLEKSMNSFSKKLN